jgi:hypothetical protein
MNIREPLMKDKKILWWRWTIANGLAELIGLGGTFVVIGLLFSGIDTQKTSGILLSFAVAIASGAIEATIVGLAQWWAMQPWFTMISRFAWWRGTLIGALLAYGLGYLPSTLMSMGEAVAQTPQAEPPAWVVMLLAAGMGAVAGVVLAFAQWLALRGKVERAGLWIPANALAWAAGMPVIFWGMDLGFEMAEVWQSVLVVAGALLAAGLIVGGIHGRFLVMLAGEGQASVQSESSSKY